MYATVVFLVVGPNDEARQVKMAFSLIGAKMRVKAGLLANTSLVKRYFPSSAVNPFASKTSMDTVLGSLFAVATSHCATVDSTPQSLFATFCNEINCFAPSSPVYSLTLHQETGH